MYCIFFRRLRRPKYFRTVIEGAGQGGTTVAEQKKNKYNMLKLAALPHQPIGTKGNFIRKLKAKQTNVNLPRNPKPKKTKKGQRYRVGPSGQMESFIRNLGTNENYVNLNPKPYKKRKKGSATAWALLGQRKLLFGNWKLNNKNVNHPKT